MIDRIKDTIRKTIEDNFDVTDITVEEPKRGLADLAIPLFPFAKRWKKPLKAIYDSFYEHIDALADIDRIEFSNGFMNLFLERESLSHRILTDVVIRDHGYGSAESARDKTVVIDYSSPNIAKSFSVGHLRSTVIGNALKRIYEKSGYRVIGINHLGDWGTQFGKMIVAYQMWGSKEAIERSPIEELQALYVRFHEAAEDDPTLEEKAREALLKLERKDPEHLELWQWFKDESLREFMEMYDLLGVTFDAYDGESFYNDKMEAVIDELDQKHLLKIDEGATIIDLGPDMPPALIKRSDGGTLYMTRDLAALLYRHRTYGFDSILYVVGNEQRLHFKQLKAISRLMGYDFDIEHINFGLVLIEGKKMSTRKGKNKRLKDVINRAIAEAGKAISSKDTELGDKDEIARAVAIGAIIFNDLKNERHLDIDFDLEHMLRFEGQTGPYIQYSSVRIESILCEHAIDLEHMDSSYYKEDAYFAIIKQINQFPSMIERARRQNAPNIIARYVLSLAQSFNRFYGNQRIVVADQSHLQANLLFIKAIQIVLNEGLRLLGIRALKEM
ncbi:MAG: arginine--tRNA ligase [Acholeplasmataceae bacterium]